MTQYVQPVQYIGMGKYVPVINHVVINSSPVDVRYRAELIVEYIASQNGLTAKTMTSRSRKAELVMCRNIAAFIMLKYLHISLLETGKLLGLANHTTVIHNRKSLINQMSYDSKLRFKVMRYEDGLRNLSIIGDQPALLKLA